MILNCTISLSLATKAAINFHIPEQFFHVCKYEGVSKFSVCQMTFQLDNSWVATMSRYFSTQFPVFQLINGTLQRQNSWYGGILMTSSYMRNSSPSGGFRRLVFLGVFGGFFWCPHPSASPWSQLLSKQESVSIRSMRSKKQILLKWLMDWAHLCLSNPLLFSFQMLDFMTRFWTHKGTHLFECRNMNIIAYD